MEEPETEEEPIPETEEEPEENFTRSGGRRASNLRRNREIASKEIPAGNKLAESKLTEDEDLSYIDSDKNNCKVYYAVNTSGYKSLGLIVNDKDKKFQVVAGQKLRSGSKTAKKSKKQIWDMAKELKDNGYEEVRGPSSVAGKVEENKTEDYWDATEIVRDLFMSLMKFNFGTDSKGNNYIIIVDANDVKRFYAKSDEEAIEIYNKFKADWENSDHADLTMNIDSIAPRNESKEVKTEGLRDVDRENDKWYLNMGMLQSLSDMDDSQIKHYATWQEYSEVYDIINSDDDINTKIQKLKELRDSIDYKIKFAVDYADTTQEAIDKWLKYYKDYIDGYIKALSIGDKYYIKIYGRYNVDYNGEPDDEPFGFTIKIENGKFEKGTKYYDTEEEAKADMETLSKDDITKYLKNIYGDTLWEWQIGVNKVSLDRVANGQLEESKEIKTEKKIIIDNMGETYTIDTDAKTYTVKTDKGEKTFTFDEMNEFVKQARGANRLYKPYSLLAYTDYKNGNLKNWEVRQDLDDDLVYKPLEKKLNDIVQNELNGDPKYTVDTFDILNSDGSIGKGIGIVTEYDGTKYAIKANANDWTLTHLGTGTRVKTFDTYQEAIDSIPEMDKSIKAMPDRVEELTKKFNDAKGIKTEGVDKSKVQDKANVVCTLNLKGEDQSISGGFDKVDINIQGVNTLTTSIKNAITKNFGGIFRSELTDKVYSQDIPVADNLWLTFLDFDENTNTLNFVLDGDVSEDKELVENKKEESVPQKEYDDILLAIDQADSVEELQDIIYAVTDGTVEDEMQSMYNTCIKDKDDLDTIKSLLTTIFEDNTEIEE